MKNLYLIVALLFTGVACQDDDPATGEENSCGGRVALTDMPVVKDLRESIDNCSCTTSIFSAYYDEQPVFYIAVTDPLCDAVFAPALYNCQGEVVRQFENTLEQHEEFYNLVTDRNIIYSCEE